MKDARDWPEVTGEGIIAVVLAGGIGARLWPLSNREEPKQVSLGVAQPSLLQRTVARLRDCAGQRRMLVVCGIEHAGLVAEQLDNASAGPVEMLLEPIRRNTAPALTAAALWVSRGDRLASTPLGGIFPGDLEPPSGGILPGDLAIPSSGGLRSDPVMIVAPADHYIQDEPGFQDSIAHACRLAAQGKVVALGVAPEYAETGYGYIELGEPADLEGARMMRAFREKPDAATAARYVADGCHAWNSGIFVMRASTWLALIGRYEREVLDACIAALPAASTVSAASATSTASTAPGMRHVLDLAALSASPTLSIDHAVMEHLAEDAPELAVAVPLRTPWTDLGSWDALWRIAEHDGKGNARRGPVMLRDVADSLVYAHDREVVCVGLKDVVVVETGQAVLVADRRHAQELARFADDLSAAGRASHLQVGNARAVRPWGTYEVLCESAGYRVKRLSVDPGQSLSLQRHRYRSEHWTVLRGQAEITLDSRRFVLAAGASAAIPVGALHRLTNIGADCLEVLETQLGQNCDEGDIERLHDMYGRASASR